MNFALAVKIGLMLIQWNDEKVSKILSTLKVLMYRADARLRVGMTNAIIVRR